MDSKSVWGDSDTQLFFSITPDIVLSAVESFGFTCTGRMLQLNSMENRVYEVEIEVEGDELTRSDRFKVIKFYRPGRWSEAQILEEHEYLRDLFEAEIPVIAPRVVDGKSVITIEGSSIMYSVFDRAGGRMVDELSGAEIEQVGRLLARIHLVGASKQAQHRLTINSSNFGTANLHYLQQKNLISITLEKQYVRCAEEIIESCKESLDLLPTQRIHGDAHIGNLLKNPSTNEFLFVDFDDKLVGPPIQDLWLLIPGRDSYGEALREKLLSGYESMKVFDRADLKVVEQLRALRLLHFAAWIGKRWNDPSFKNAFDYYGTDQYWQEQLSHMQEQLRLIQSV